MASEHAKKLMDKATAFVNNLNRNKIDAQILKDSLREYSIKVILPDGKAIIYYKPKNNTFRCNPENVRDNEIWKKVINVWEGSDEIIQDSRGKMSLSSENKISIFVDGSFIKDSAGYGLVVVQNDSVIYEKSGQVDPNETMGTRQVAGELHAVLHALEWCQDNRITEVDIYYDYKGIECWIMGEWQAKNPLTKRYRDTVRQSNLRITWKKVNAHTGVRWNERADQLAKEGATRNPRQGRYGANERIDDFANKEGAGRSRITDSVDPLKELEEFVAKFIELTSDLAETFEVRKKSDHSTVHIQVAVSSGDKSFGYLNFYNTKKKGCYPSFHEINQGEILKEFKNRWENFNWLNRDDHGEIDHYFKILEPYSKLNFDFIDLAKAIEKVWARKMPDRLDIDKVRYDFEALRRYRERLASYSK